MAATPHKLMIVLRHSPYGSSLARSGIDIALAAGAFEQPVTVLFTGPGVLQLVDNQQGDLLDRKTLGKVLASLPLYDIEAVYADTQSLQEHQVDVTRAPLPVTALSSDEVHALLDSHHHVLGL